ncbi:hypothetical protein FA10DRAFT_257816 [Acaromyces ingoldii]|uniref:Uncharacterized protein n=1 Tax=Acaromyces ingoldii TaxID=215250 RepID=A0A316Z0C2_9BASI|nr:hypothetical protein FA10DRAFT_257816 [Acaromyces ingoldii]PWN93545.1 hypothetical protein FA10DRAFT_257816 [Acaromyces ingoldii]
MPSLLKAKLREYDTAIATSPVRHAIFNRPFTQLVKKTEVLLDQITGATLPPEVLQEERERELRERALTCRGCKSTYGDEKGLRSHHALFPSHINPPRKPKPSRRPHRSQSTSDALSQATNKPVLPPTASAREQERPAMKHSSSAADVLGLSPSSIDPSHEQPADDYRAHFSPLNADGDVPPPSVPTRRLPQIEDHDKDLLPHARRNYDAGAASAARRLPVGASPPSITSITRSASESALNALQSIVGHDEKDVGEQESRPALAQSPSFSNVIRAVIATGATGPSGQAVMASTAPDSPLNAARSSPADAWIPLPDEEAVPSAKAAAPKPTASAGRTRKGSLSALKTLASTPLAAPTAPSASVTFGATPATGPVTGLTSFSDASVPAAVQDGKGTSAKSQTMPVIRRKNTNPFLYQLFDAASPISPPASPQAFLASRTPPLDPSTPRTPLSPKNPFSRLLDDDFYDDQDAEEAPQTPGDTLSYTRRKPVPAAASVYAKEHERIFAAAERSAPVSSPHFDAFLAANEEPESPTAKFHAGAISQEEYLSSFF